MRRPELVVAGGTAVVTGAAGGMGEHIAKGLARRGADLVLLDRDAAGLDRVVADIGRETPGAGVTPFVVDLADRTATDEVIAAIAADHADVTMLFNNAGVAVGGRFVQVSADDFDWLLEINLLAPIRFTRALLPLMLANGQGQVVNTSSLFGLVGPPGQSAYCTSKFGLRGFSESLRSELEAEAAPVGVTVVHPGGIRTNIAVNARVAEGVDPEEAERNKRAFAKMLSYPADRAAGEIVDAAIARAPRLLIGKDAKALDKLARLTPSHYWSLMGRAMALAAKRAG
ncbi:SDR family NAD(P)-dependent oxidoreductase [Janibacter anophelis]|uniref:SDR family NAD(P)-dependent oxidoreductase n=1 Tax=Janibacter anophelis TaxID=319054 RepID=UPI000834A0C1|nr:SDR family NAD(P)-dependent oxidoreductase [Janibacter anophelis]